MQLTRRKALCMLGSVATLPAWPALADNRLARLYDEALVIDALSFGHEWTDVEFAALRAAGYSGIVESLPRSDLQTAIDALMQWQRPAAEHSDRILLALSATDFERARQSGRPAVLMNFQNATMLEDEIGNVESSQTRAVQRHIKAPNAQGVQCHEKFLCSPGRSSRLPDRSRSRTVPCFGGHMGAGQ